MTFNLIPETSKSLVKKHLTKETYEALRHTTTESGYTLAQAIRSGVKNPDSAIGIYAGDAQCYKLFAKIFDPIIHDYHGLARGTRHTSDMHALDLFDPDPEKKYILSTRIRVARNLTGFSFTSHINIDQRKILEHQIVQALNQLESELRGSYFSLDQTEGFTNMSNHGSDLLFKRGDRFQEAAGINSDFPRCRGVYCAESKPFRVWVNEEDHLRIICQDRASDLSSVFNHLRKALVALEQTLDFAADDTYGYLSSCPTNIGTAMRAGVHIHLDKLNRNRTRLATLVEKHNLQIRGTSGEKTPIENGIFDISNRRRLGVSEVDIITNLNNGLSAIVEAEKNL